MTITLFTRTFRSSLFKSVKFKDTEYMSPMTEVAKGFLVSLKLLCFHGDLREKSY